MELKLKINLLVYDKWLFIDYGKYKVMWIVLVIIFVWLNKIIILGKLFYLYKIYNVVYKIV